jgi:hypothetical protein
MGMSSFFAAIDAKTLAQIEDDPSLMESFLYPDDGDGEPEHSMDVDKAWHGIHFLLNGTADSGDGPLALTVLGGEPMGEDMGMGPARVLRPDEVKAVAAALATITPEQFASNYDPAKMTKLQIYPDAIWERDGSEGLAYIVDNFEPLVAFYQETAARGDGMILVIC